MMVNRQQAPTQAMSDDLVHGIVTAFTPADDQQFARRIDDCRRVQAARSRGDFTSQFRQSSLYMPLDPCHFFPS